MHETSTLEMGLPPLRDSRRGPLFGPTRFLRRVFAIMLSAALLVLAPSAAAQLAGTASIQGTVTDPTGAVIPGPAVTIVETATQLKQTTTCDHDGIFSFPNCILPERSTSSHAPEATSSMDRRSTLFAITTSMPSTTSPPSPISFTRISSEAPSAGLFFATSSSALRATSVSNPRRPPMQQLPLFRQPPTCRATSPQLNLLPVPALRFNSSTRRPVPSCQATRNFAPLRAPEHAASTRIFQHLEPPQLQQSVH